MAVVVRIWRTAESTRLVLQQSRVLVAGRRRRRVLSIRIGGGVARWWIRCRRVLWGVSTICEGIVGHASRICLQTRGVARRGL